MVASYVCASSPVTLSLHGHLIWIITFGPNSGRLTDFTCGSTGAQDLLFLQYLWRSSAGHWKIQGGGNAANSVLGAKSNSPGDVVWVLLTYPSAGSCCLVSSLQGGDHKIKFKTYSDTRKIWRPPDILHFWAFVLYRLILRGKGRSFPGKTALPWAQAVLLGELDSCSALALPPFLRGASPGT